MSAAQTLEQLHRLLNLLWAAEGKSADGLSYNEFAYLRLIDELNGAGVSKAHAGQDHHGPHLTDLAEGLGVKRASASTMLAKLEKLDYIKRLDCQHDARAQHIMLTPEGQQLLQTGAALYEDIASRLLGDLQVSQLEQINKMVTNMISQKLAAPTQD